MRVLFAPDFRAGAPYQQPLADALGAEGVEVVFLSHYRRMLPLARGSAGLPADILHLHWPEAYFKPGPLRWLRVLRYLPDLWLATRHRPLVLTAHNLYPHDRGAEPGIRPLLRRTYRRARCVIAHSAAAAAQLQTEFDVDPARIAIIPHGDLSTGMPFPPPRAEARAQLGLDGTPVCLVFGAVGPYKGIEEMIQAWAHLRPPAALHIVGRARAPEYERAIVAAARDVPGVHLHLGWQEPAVLGRWLAAADCVLFNYQKLLTSGAACLARSLGVPMLLPRRLDALDLHEPHRHVRRFDGFGPDFLTALRDVLGEKPDYAAGAEWRAATAWSRVAAETARHYRALLPS